MNARRLLLALMMTASSAHVGSTAIEAGATSGHLSSRSKAFEASPVTLGSRCSTATQVFPTTNQLHTERS